MPKILEKQRMNTFKKAKITIGNPNDFTASDGIVSTEDERFGIVSEKGIAKVVLVHAGKSFAHFLSMIAAKEFVSLLLANPVKGVDWPKSWEASNIMPRDTSDALEAHTKYLSKLACKEAERQASEASRKRLEKKALKAFHSIQNTSTFDLKKLIATAPDVVLIDIARINVRINKGKPDELETNQVAS